jgi:hypothetical protein
MSMSDQRQTRLFVLLAGFFVTHAITANLIGLKIFALGPSLGLAPIEFMLFGQQLSLDLTAGVLLWPAVFLLTDVINEYFGAKGVRFLSWLTAFLIVYVSAAVGIAIALVPATWWPGSSGTDSVPDMQAAYRVIFGTGIWSIAGSVIAFVIGQIIDIAVFQWLRARTGAGKIWLRATGSTMVGQLIDSFVVLYIAFVLGPAQWSTSQWLAIGSMNYLYKCVVAVALIPFLYLLHAGIRRYLGRDEERR